jgi:predicted alpha/beta superfamily hydrolase
MHMIKKLQILAITGFLIIAHQIVYAQADHHPRFLKKTGVLDSLYSEILEESREIYIQLPADYSPEDNQNYPVVYILDGEVFLPTVRNVLDFYSGGFMPEMVIIGVSNSRNRMRDLTTSTIKTMYGRPFREKNGEAANFIRFLEEELIPFIENKYPVSNYRTLIGHSYGGLFAIYTLINHPHLFANYIAIDPSLDWNNQNLLELSRDVLPAQSFKGKSLFVSLGGQLHMQNPEITIENVMQDSSDFTLFARSNIAFSNLVRQNSGNGLSFEWKFYPGDLHGTIAYPSIKDGLVSVFEWFQMEHTNKFNSPDTPRDELYGIVKNRANKLQSHFGYVVPPYPEDLLNILGLMSLDMQQSEKAKMFLEFAIAYYPQSANACDSMADYYESQNDPDNALKYAVKAYELSGSEYHKRRMEGLESRLK